MPSGSRISSQDDALHAKPILDGLKVLEVEPSDAARYCTRLLASIGAEVLKVEARVGDPVRRAGPFRPGHLGLETGAKHLWLDAGKESICLDYRAPEGAELFRELATRAAVIVHSLSEREFRERGLTDVDAIVVTMLPFGSTGPYAHYQADHIVEQALSGYMYHNGEPGEMPLMGNELHEQQIAGLHGFIGIMASLIGRLNNVSCNEIEVATMECMVTMHLETVGMYTLTGAVRPRLGNRYPTGHPLTIWPCKDGYIAITVIQPHQWEMLCVLLDKPDLQHDERFSTPGMRLINWHALDDEVRPWLMERTREEIFANAQRLRVPVAPVWDIGEVLENEHLVERGFWQDVECGELGIMRYPWPPVRLSDGAMQVRPSPRLGQHTEQVLRRWLGRSTEDLGWLMAARVLY